MNNKAFTLIELLAVVVILGILMTIAIPNTVSLIDKNKQTSYIEDAKTFISLVQSKVKTDKSLELPSSADVVSGKSTTALIVTLGYLNTNDIDTSPYGEEYSEDLSFVAVVIDSNKYVYYVHLISCTDDTCNSYNNNSWRGIDWATMSDLNGDDRYSFVSSSGADGDLIEDYTSNSVLSGRTVYIAS